MYREIVHSKRTAVAMWQTIRRSTVRTDGTALIEFAIIAPVIFVIVLGVLDFGLLAFRQMEVQNAVQAGAEYAVQNGYSSTSISTAVINASPTFAGEGLTVTVNEFCGCPSSTGVTQISTGTCSATSTCTGSAVVGNYVNVSASATYDTVVRYAHFKLGSYPLTASATVRVP